MPAKSFADIDFATYAVSFGDTPATLGWVLTCDMSQLKLKKLEVTVGEIGPIVIDHAIIGIEGTLSIELEQPKVATLRQTIVDAPGTGSIPLNPAARYDRMYQYAALLKFHPDGDAGETNDINILKAAPDLALPQWGGDKKRKIAVPWFIYPDQTVLAADGTLVYGYVGALPE